MSTFTQLTDRVEALLHGYTENTEPTSWLTTSATTASTTLTVYDATVVGRGYIEIDDEIVFVNNTDNVANTLTLAPGGRAQRGTTAAAHSTNAKVTVSPLFPRQEIKNAINDTINAMYPMVFGVASYDFTYVAAQYSYSIPAAVENILYLLIFQFSSVVP